MHTLTDIPIMISAFILCALILVVYFMAIDLNRRFKEHLIDHVPPMKQKVNKYALDDDQVKILLYQLKEGWTKDHAAKHFGVSRQTIYATLKRVKDTNRKRKP